MSNESTEQQSNSDLDRDTLEKLLEGRLPWEELRNEVLPDPKDTSRFTQIREILQDRVDWDEPILLPLNDHLYVVGKNDERIVKAECGHELCNVAENWKTECRIRVRRDRGDMTDLYPAAQTPDPDWKFQLREFLCPSCFTLIHVDAVPTGYPVMKPFDPDIETFYEDWLDEVPPDKESST